MPERRKRERCRRAALGPPAAVRGHPASIMSTSGGGGTDPRAADRSSWGSGARPRQRRRAEKGAAWWSRYERGNADLARTGRPTWLVSAVRRVDRTVAACRHAFGRGGSVTVQASASSGRARGTRSRVRSSYGARARQRDPRGASTSGRDALGRSARHSRRSALQRRPDSFRADVRVVRSRAGQRHRPRRAERHDPTARPHRVFTCSTASARSSSRRRRI